MNKINCLDSVEFKARSLRGRVFPIELEFGIVDFCGGKKIRETLGARTRTNSKFNPHMTPGPGIEPGQQWWEVSAVTTVPPLLPYAHALLP